MQSSSESGSDSDRSKNSFQLDAKSAGDSSESYLESSSNAEDEGDLWDLEANSGDS